MTLFLSAGDVSALATHDVAMAAALEAVQADRDGATAVAERLDVDLDHGFLRVMPGAVGDLMGLKIMTLVEGVGNRYLLLVYRQSTGALLALIDADEITRLRTAATTAVAARLLQPEAQDRIGLVGSGFEATAHLRALAGIWPLREAAVYSPSVRRRERFCARMSAELNLDVRPVASAGEACAAAATLVLATKARFPVIVAEDVPRGCVVLSIGSTRPDLRELDRGTLERAAVVLVDDAEQVARESGDIIEALEDAALGREHLVSMGTALADPASLMRADGRDVLAFKSVGTIVQDLTLAGALIDAAADAGLGRDLGELTHLKAASGPTVAVMKAAKG